jgi:thrombospondin type 3 repeat protein
MRPLASLVHAFGLSIALGGSASAALYPNGITQADGVTLAALQADGWTVMYNVPYGSVTTTGHVNQWRALANAAYGFVFLGAVDLNGNVVVGASGLAQEVLTPTDSTSQASAYPSTGLYWYNKLGWSIGFTPTSNILLNTSDITGILTTNDGQNARRLSWHLDQDIGGWRAGATGFLNDNSILRKVVLVLTSQNADADGDGIPNGQDNCVTNPNPGQQNSDGDALGDACDPCPLDPANDVDHDGLCGDVDPCPGDPGNDEDQDGVCGGVDNCPLVPNGDQANADNDALGDACDPCPLDPANDADGDGLCAGVDPCPSDPLNDEDQDGVCGDVDNCRFAANGNQANADGDGFGDACDPCPLDPGNDVDGDTLCAGVDPCPSDPLNDGDQDGHCADVDNCRFVPNADQANADGDGLGDACDACPLDPANDVDADGLCAAADNCPFVPNAGQADADVDGLGDACDNCPLDPANDVDLDGICASADNCPGVFNPGQEDSDAVGLGYTVTRRIDEPILDPDALPGSRPLTICDDCSTFVSFEGHPFFYFGYAQAGVYVSANGFLQFNTGASLGFLEVLSEDLNPPANPSGYRANLLGDRLVVTWRHIPYYPGFGDLTFQVTLHFGTDEIELNYDVISGGGAGGVGFTPRSSYDLAFDFASLSVGSTRIFNSGQSFGRYYNPFSVMQNSVFRIHTGDDLGDACDPCPGDPLSDVDGDGSCGNDVCYFDYNPSQSDVDHDSEGDHCDLDDGIIYLVPSDPGYVTWQEEEGTTAWSAYLGDLGTLRATGVYTQVPGSNPLAARYCELNEPRIPDPGAPPPGSVRFVLVTGFTAGNEGSLGTDSAGVERPNTLPCP